ncbi:ankyrin repeat-containing domain protein [Sphaerosporella brunnea]|uniref:Ankyrin repeat-containing domain protein n=1 Tax=Sphaerosporella brunnea TaxID=1250544 RepID=A0A5J5EWH4_9PEZI|nr:ankyrin repeat-containing domain protein [Sphaerosporella brunnea]
MPAPGFGFSVGDFLAVLDLIWKVTQALSESAGAVHSVQTILETLMSFQRAISTCQTLALEWSQLVGGDATIPERSLVNGIQHQLKFCRERLLKLLAKLEPYTRAFMKQRASRTARDQLYKVKWIFTREEVDNLQKDISIHVQGLERYITELGIQIMLRTVKQSQATTTTALASIDRTVADIHHQLTSLHTELPKILGYAWEGGYSAHDKPIILMDALGRNVPIPFLFCTSSTDFHDLVELMFRHLPGHERVKRKSYNLLTQNSGEMIEASRWSTAVSPGSVIVMSIGVSVAVTDWEIRAGSSHLSCPRCHQKMPPQRGATARCSRCYRDCTIMERKHIVQLAPQPVRPLSMPNITSESGGNRKTRSATLTKRANNRAELAQFQRIHIIRERVQPGWGYQVQHPQIQSGDFIARPSALHLAIQSGSLSEVERLLMDEEEIELEARDQVGNDTLRGWTPLQRAAHLGDSTIVDCLIQAGADINASATEESGRTALQAAVESGSLTIVDRLLTAGADVNAPAAALFGRTALQAAAESGDLKIVERLLAAGAEVNAAASDEDGITALPAAAGSRNLVLVERLLAAGAEVNTSPERFMGGQTALQAAAEVGSLEIVERLLAEGAEVNASAWGTIGRTTLQAAAEVRNLKMVELLLAKGADVHARNGTGRTALQTAAEAGNVEIVERLLAAGADVNASPGKAYGRTALQGAAEFGCLKVLERLLTEGAEVNAAAAPWGGRTALQAAAESEHLDMVARLLAEGAEVNAPASNTEGRTALQAAAEVGDLEIIGRLLEAGAHVNAPATASHGRTALQAAAGSGHLETVERLLAEGADVNSPGCKWHGRTALQAAAEVGELEIVERLLEYGADVNAPAGENFGRTALQAAASSGSLETVERLLAAGADVNAPCAKSHGQSALEAAQKSGNRGIVKLLLQAGATRL